MREFYPVLEFSANGNSSLGFLRGNKRRGIISVMTKTPLREVLAANVRYYMRELPHVDKQVKLSKRSGIAQSSVNRVLAAQVDAQLSIVEGLAKGIGVPPSQLLTERGAVELPPSLDPRRLALLSAEDQQKLGAFAEFLLTQTPNVAPGTEEISAFDSTHAASKQDRESAKRIAGRPLSNDSLSLDPHDKSTTRDQTLRRRK
ncbi:hypothetical protein [Pandoraea sp. ISTKB]|uniref:hypothetical protein n=1 Tax=Pandoraea sp. ISTKB TaxID=1586708 RepID=UPI0009F22393|nr:hypothetical protein [Pandoraea sp. ISTKB]